MMRTRGGLVAFSCAVGLLITTSAPALADNTITVTTTSDEVANNGPCSLREALAEANAPGTIDDCPGAVAGQPTTIVLDAHVYEWTHGEVVISTQSGLTIRGASASDPSQTKIDAKHTSRIFTVDSAADLAITALTLTGGKAPDGARGNDGGTGVDGAAGNPGGAGGAILNYGHVTLTDAAVAGNRAGDGGDGGPGAHGGLNSLPTRGGEGGHGGDGGGIVNYGTLALTRTVVSDNASGAGGAGGAPGDYYFDSFQGSDGLAASDGGLGGFGGGISNLGTMTMTHSTVRANTTGAGGDGGPGGNGAPGVCGDAGSGQPQYDGGSGAVGGTGVTAGRGGGISNYGTLTVSDSTIATNQTGPGGSGGAGGGGGVGAYFSCEASNADTTSDGGPGGTGGLGGSGGSGGGLFNAGSLTLTGAIISGNIAGIGGAGGSGGGGGYGSDGCDFDSGSGGNGGKGGAAGPGGPGGGVGMIDGSLSVTNVTIYNNTAGDGGLGGFIGPGGGAGRVGGFLNCGSNGHVGSAGSDGTPAGDGGDGGSGGGLVVAGTVTGAQVAHATIDANSAGGPGGTFAGLGGSPGSPGVAGGVAGGAGASVTVLNSIMSVDAPAGGCAGTVVDGGHNVTSGGDTACPGVGGDVKLGLLQDNGGPTLTQRIAPGSAAIDVVPASGQGCADTDQRGVARPQGSACDAGAFELTAPTCSDVATSTSHDQARVVQLACADPDPAVATLGFVLDSQPAHGALGPVGADGTVTYTPASGYVGPDAFTYHATDANGTAAVRSVSLTVAKSASTTAISCAPSLVIPGSATSCAVTVTDATAAGAGPVGTVGLSSNGAGTFGGACTLAPSATAGVSRCTTSYTPSAAGTGTHTLTASFPGDSTRTASAGSSQAAVGKAGSATNVSCQPGTVVVGSGTTCVATVTGAGAPTGTVAFTTSEAGQFAGGGTCLLAQTGAAGEARCQVEYTPSAAGSGTHVITAAYAGDDAHAGGHATTNVLVTKSRVAPVITLAAKRVRVKRRTGVGSLRAACSAPPDDACVVKAKLTFKRKPAGRLTGTIPAGRAAKLRIKLNLKARRALRHKHRLNVTAIGTVTDQSGTSAPLRVTIGVTLRR